MTCSSGNPANSSDPAGPDEAALNFQFEARVASGWPAVVSALRTLYGHRDDFGKFMQRLEELLRNSHLERCRDLRLLDAERLSAPDWFQQPSMLGYSTYVDRFAGTIAGVAEKIGYLRELGVTYLHLLPLFKSRAGDSDGGFAIVDHRDIEPRLGTIDDLRRLADGLRGEGISLCVDIVCNHTAQEHPWAERACAGDPVYRDYYLVFPDRTLPDQYETDLDEIFPDTAPTNFTYVPALQGWVWTTFYPFQWDLNYAVPDVFAELLITVLHLANLGVEAFRLDSTAFLWKQLGTKSQNLPETHLLLQTLRTLVQMVAPGVLLKAEAIVSASELLPYFGPDGPRVQECQLAYHCTLMASLWAALSEGQIDRLSATMDRLPAVPQDCSWLLYLRCHDDIGWSVLRPEILPAEGDPDLVLSRLSNGLTTGEARGRSFQGSDSWRTNGMLASLVGLESALESGNSAKIDLALCRIMLLHGLIFAFGGIPTIYMGDEIGLVNVDAEKQPASVVDGRWLHRPWMHWAAGDDRHRLGSAAQKVFDGLRRLIELRRNIPQFHARASLTRVPSGNPSVLRFSRRDAKGCIIVLANFSDKSQAINSVAAGTDGPLRGIDLISGNATSANGGVEIGPYGLLWLSEPHATLDPGVNDQLKTLAHKAFRTTDG